MTTPPPQIYKIGVTGLIGTGKSAVARMLNQMDVATLDVDQVYHQLYDEDTTIKENLIKCFGREILNENGAIVPMALDKLANAHSGQRMILERIVHDRVEAKIQAFFRAGDIPQTIRAVVCPLLFEVNLEKLFDEVWVVVVEPEERLIDRIRTMFSDLSPDEARAWAHSQWDQAMLAEKAYRVINNSGTPEETRRHIYSALNDIQYAVFGISPYANQ